MQNAKYKMQIYLIRAMCEVCKMKKQRQLDLDKGSREDIKVCQRYAKCMHCSELGHRLDSK